LISLYFLRKTLVARNFTLPLTQAVVCLYRVAAHGFANFLHFVSESTWLVLFSLGL